MEVTTSQHSIPAVALTRRVIIDRQTITAPITTGVTLASLCTGAVIPSGAVVAEIQADGGTIRIGLKAAQTATPTSGMRLDDGASRIIDTPLADVTVVSTSAATVPAQVAFFDRV